MESKEIKELHYKRFKFPKGITTLQIPVILPDISEESFIDAILKVRNKVGRSSSSNATLIYKISEYHNRIYKSYDAIVSIEKV